MLNNFCISLTRSTDDPDRATVAMVVANAAASGKQTMVFLSSEGVRLGVKGVADQISEEGFQPMTTLLQNFLAVGGSVWVCSPCFKKRGYNDGDLIEGRPSLAVPSSSSSYPTTGRGFRTNDDFVRG